MDLSHLLKFPLTILSLLLKLLGMSHSPNYRKAYKAAKRELAKLLSDQQRIEKRLVIVRQSLQTLAALCESKGIEISLSEEADILLKHTALAEEIRNILNSEYPKQLRPGEVKEHLKRLGHDLDKYNNPQAAIQMVLKRLVESGEAEEGQSEDGKKTYSVVNLAAMYGLAASDRKERRPPILPIRRRRFGSPPAAHQRL